MYSTFSQADIYTDNAIRMSEPYDWSVRVTFAFGNRFTISTARADETPRVAVSILVHVFKGVRFTLFFIAVAVLDFTVRR